MSNHSSRNPWLHPSFALLLPAALLAVGVWQLTRMTGVPEGYQAQAGRLEASIGRLQPLATRDPRAVVRFEGSNLSFTAADALQRMEARAGELRRDVLVEKGRVGAAWVAVVGGGIALLAALVGLAATIAGAWRGRTSRAALVRAFRAVMRITRPLLGCVALATALAMTGAVLFEVGGAWFWNGFSVGEAKLILGGLCVAGMALVFAVSSIRQLRRALDAFTPHPLQVLGRVVTPAEAPGLWTYLRAVAERQGAGVPDNVVLGLTQGFFVTSSHVLVAPEARELAGRTLYLPATLMSLLSPAEIAAIIAHELAHFTGEDTQYSQHFLPLYASMSRSLRAVTSGRQTGTGLDAVFQPAAILALHVLDTFSRVVSHWSRLREFEADRASLRVGRAQDAATALLRTGMAAGLVGATLQDVYGRPSRAGDDIVGAIAARAGAVGFSDAQRHLEDRQPHPTDTHPPTRQRIEALGVAVDDALLDAASRPLRPEDSTFVDRLFSDWTGLRRALGADLLAVAHAQDQRLQATLEEAAGAVDADVPVHERAQLATLGLGVPGGILIAAGLFLTWVALRSGWVPSHDAPVLIGTASLVGAFGAVFVAIAFLRYRRGQAGPFLVVGPSGFRCLGIAEPVPWSAVEGIQVTVGQAFVTTFRLNATAPLPERKGRPFSVAVNRRRRTLTLKGYVPRGMTAQAFLDLLNRARRAHHAQALLRARESEVQEG